MTRLKHSILVLCAACCLVTALAAETVDEIASAFAHPPDDARIMMRWWWFGPAVEKPEIARELHIMRDAGIGGVEVQPVYPVALDDPDHGIRNLPYLSDAFLDHLSFAADTARKLGMRIDITLGSGWPYGGPHTEITNGAGMLRCDRVMAPSEASSLPLPSLEAGEKFLAAFLARGDRRHFSSEGIQRLDRIEAGRIALPPNRGGPQVVLFFISSRTGQQVKRAAVGADGFVLDHYDRAAIENHLRTVADRLIQAFGTHPPYSVFSDSLEVYGSDWTGDFLEEFQKRRGYDLTPYLPALVGDIGAKTMDVRHDWGETLTELANERYLAPIEEWARRHGTRFRSQTYGIPPVILSSNALVDLPEGEGYQWRQFAPTRWASSANHLYGRPVTSSETWTWLHSPVFRATPLDMKAEADLHFLEGVNQLVGHGWPYSPPQAGEPGWRFYAAAVFNNHNPWFLVMPDIAQYLQRVSYVLRQGNSVNDVAVYLPTDDAWARFEPERISVSEQMNELLGPELIPQILDAGYSFDFIDDAAIERLGVKYPILVLPKVERMPARTKQKLEEYRRGGGIVIDSASRGAGVNLGQALVTLYKPDFVTSNPTIGFVHRKLADGEIYFIANTGNKAVHTLARARVSGMTGEWWDPFTGAKNDARVAADAIPLEFAPYESRILVFSHQAFSHGPAERPQPETASRESMSIDLSSDWKVTFEKLGRTIEMNRLRSWADDEQTRFYSGEAIYEKSAVVPESILDAPEVVLDFGPGTVPAPHPGPLTQGFRADLDSPVREAAVVYVNGNRAGSVWHPPYELEVKKLLREGTNQFRIVVSNLAVNELAGQSAPDYRLLNLRYAPSRFEPQDMQTVRAEPSGILGAVKLVTK